MADTCEGQTGGFGLKMGRWGFGGTICDEFPATFSYSIYFFVVYSVALSLRRGRIGR